MHGERELSVFVVIAKKKYHDAEGLSTEREGLRF